jgi:hypothetical protein
MNKRKNGFSMIELMIMIGAVAGIALVVMQLSKSTAQSQADAFSMADYITLKTEVDNFFNNDFDCTTTLKDVAFKGSTIKANPIELELWHGDQFQTKVRKFLSGTDKAANRYGKLNISSVTFNMPDYSGSSNFPQGNSESFKAEIHIEGDKNKMGKSQTFQTIKKTIRVMFDTDSSGESKIKECAVNSSASGSGLGIGQTWQDVTSMRTQDKEFVNDSGKPILISVSVGPNSSSGISEVYIYVNNKVVAHSSGEWNSTNGYLNVNTVVTNGDSYKVSTFGKMGLQNWSELR